VETVQLAAVGAPEQLSETVWLNPLKGRTTSVEFADCPAEMIAVGGERERVKSGLPPVPLPFKLTTVAHDAEIIADA
jgi:hypothetical protein